jgi:hypothetical protein
MSTSATRISMRSSHPAARHALPQEIQELDLPLLLHLAISQFRHGVDEIYRTYDVIT